MKTLIVFFVVSLLCGCGSSSVPIIFEPVASPTLTTIYSNGIPIARPSTDSLSFLLSLDHAWVGNTRYYRLWVLCQNTSQSTILLEPSRIFSLAISGNKPSNRSVTANIKPELPSNVLSQIEAEEAFQSIVTVIGGALEVASTSNTTISSSSGKTTQINDAAEKRKTINKETSSTLASVSNWYGVFKQSINSGILRKNTLYPGQSINGYVYFDNTLYRSVYKQTGVFNLEDYQYKLRMELPDKVQIIPFAAIKGE